MKAKKRDLKGFLGICFVLVLVACSSPVKKVAGRRNATETLSKPYVLLISIDGYRADYTDRFNPPTLKKFRDEGAAAKYLLPVYPSKTFTNHYSIATGLYAENHGIVANIFFDPARNQTYKLSDRKMVEDGTWYGGVPLWVASEHQGMLVGTYFWPASEAPVLGVRPTYYVNYDDKISHLKRTRQVVEWFKLPEEDRPHLVTLYFSDVDSAGHKFGPNSQEVKDSVLKVDQSLGLLLQDLEKENLHPNIVIVSDHGMQEMDLQKIEYLDDYADLKGVKVLGAGPQSLIYTKNEAQTHSLYQALRKGKHFKVYRRKDLPAQWHYSKNQRAGDLIVVAQAPWGVMLRKSADKFEKGTHGFDPDTTESMRAIFYAAGPEIQKAKVLAPFRNIHIYPFILELLKLKTEAPIDGSAAVLKSVFKK